jgi:hypothetical protein
MKILFFIAIYLIAFDSFGSVAPDRQSEGIMGLLGLIGDFFYTIYSFLFDYLPSLITRFFVWLTAWSLKIKFYFMYQGLIFAHAVATTFLDLIDISSFVNSAISALPQDMKQLASDFRFFESLTLVVEAWITKLVYSNS